MSIFEQVISWIVGTLIVICAYRGVLGSFAYKCTRIPLAIIGNLFLALAMNGVAVEPIREHEYEDEKEEVREVEVPNDPGKEDDKTAKQVWSLRGLTPFDIRNQCTSQRTGVHYPDEEMDHYGVSAEPLESTAEFVARREMQRRAG